jgi:hypothetical protein
MGSGLRVVNGPTTNLRRPVRRERMDKEIKDASSARNIYLDGRASCARCIEEPLNILAGS